ncbi:TIR domain-containing protein [Nocardioides sp.]|uniref:TIR domain-containing protein n=1 Tax=Nocardioides sp. TaxID=35761 RepID=UPI001A2E3EDA|nr:TIR domain-containing protein [Nocardioides sp.]MBJ7358645.1 TIR domain-containing protein [Nocardioides sp.]
MTLRVEDVFKVQGVPTYTFVHPSSFNQLKVGLRTPGRGVIVEGPSGIGKSTAVTKVLEELNLDSSVTSLSARDPVDAEYIALLPEMTSTGTVIIDDFHRLEDATKASIADLLKITADREDAQRKIVIVGINAAGRSLIESAPDLANRMEVIRFEVEPASKIQELVDAGEAALNVRLAARDHIIENSRGSFYIAQLLCWQACVEAGVLEKPDDVVEVDTSYTAVQRKVVERQKERFGAAVRAFARGTKFRPSGRAPYLHILRWLADAESWSIHIPDEMRKHPNEKQSVGVVRERGYLASLCEQEDISKLLHYGRDTGLLSVEDPMLVYYLRSINWADFIREVGFTKVDYDENYDENYDVALSFAGEDRIYAEHMRDALEDLGHSVFYDFAEQHRILGEDVEAYLGPIYESNSRYVVAILGEMYGRKRWTLFEHEKYKDRVERGQVLPIWSTKVPPAASDPVRERGGLTFDPDGNLRAQAIEHSEIISKKLSEL